MNNFDFRLFLGSVFVLISVGILSYFLVSVFHKKWDELQKKQADKTSAQFGEMFIFVKAKRLLILYATLPLLLAIGSYLLFSNKPYLVVVFFILGCILPWWIVNSMDKHRRAKFVMQLVDGLMIMNSCLKGGLTLPQSFEVLAEETTPPMSQEIGLLNREIKVGVTLEEALLRLDKRMPSEEMTLVVSAVLVARETGGDLTKVFSRLVETIRDRIKLREMVATLTLQARLQSVIISLLGPVFVYVVRKIKPDHFDIMLKDDMGRMFLGIAVGLQILGIILIVIFGKIEI